MAKAREFIAGYTYDDGENKELRMCDENTVAAVASLFDEIEEARAGRRSTKPYEPISLDDEKRAAEFASRWAETSRAETQMAFQIEEMILAVRRDERERMEQLKR